MMNFYCFSETKSEMRAPLLQVLLSHQFRTKVCGSYFLRFCIFFRSLKRIVCKDSDIINGMSISKLSQWYEGTLRFCDTKTLRVLLFSRVFVEPDSAAVQRFLPGNSSLTSAVATLTDKLYDSLMGKNSSRDFVSVWQLLASVIRVQKGSETRFRSYLHIQ